MINKLIAALIVAFLIVFAISILLNYHPKYSYRLSSLPTPTPSKLSYVEHGSRSEPKIALTFDADMTPGMALEQKLDKVKSWYNQAATDILVQEKVPATIFFTGLWVEMYPDVTRSLANNPLFEVANHSYTHPGFSNNCYGLPALPIWGRAGEINKAQETISKITGITPKYFRFPGGCHTQDDVNLVNQKGLAVVAWDVASGDGFNQNTQSIIDKVEKSVQNGSIIVFHLHGGRDAPKTAQALPTIIKNLRTRGFQFVKLSDMDLSSTSPLTPSPKPKR